MRGKAASPGDTNISANGYHYTRTEVRWRLTHHLIAEDKLGRELTKAEQVFFVDGDRTNLDPENIGVRAKQTNDTKRKGQLYSRIEQLLVEYFEVVGPLAEAELVELVQETAKL